MCAHGNEVILNVPIPANLSHTGEFRWDNKAVDKCISTIVQALNDAHIYTASCCCGHDVTEPEIILHDGRVIRIINPS